MMVTGDGSYRKGADDDTKEHDHDIPYDNYPEETGYVHYIGNGAQTNWQTKVGKGGEGKSRFEGECWVCGKRGQKGRDCWQNAGGKGRGSRKETRKGPQRGPRERKSLEPRQPFSFLS